MTADVTDIHEKPGRFARWKEQLPVPWRRNPLLWTQVLTVAVFVLWISWFPLDVASYAQGQVIPAGQLKKIQHLEGGIIREIHVTEGQQVAQGTVIADLEDVASNSDVGELTSRAASLQIKVLRLTASLTGQDRMQIPPELEKAVPDVVRDARSALSSYRDRFVAMVQTREARIAQRKAEIQESKERLLGLQSRSKIIADQVRISEQMLKQKLNSEYEHLQLLKEQSQIDSDRNTTVATQQRSATALQEEIASLASFRKEEEVGLRKELLDANTEWNSLKERLRKPSDSFDRTQVRAPVAGSVMTLYFKNRGAVVPPGGTIATLVPEGEALLVEAKLPIGDVGFVRPGAPARLSLPTGASGFSTIDAEVVHISPDSTVDEKNGSSYFIVRLKPKLFVFKRGAESYPLRPGVQVTSAIITGQRSVLSLLMEPFLGNGIRPLTER